MIVRTKKPLLRTCVPNSCLVHELSLTCCLARQLEHQPDFYSSPINCIKIKLLFFSVCPRQKTEKSYLTRGCQLLRNIFVQFSGSKQYFYAKVIYRPATVTNENVVHENIVPCISNKKNKKILKQSPKGWKKKKPANYSLYHGELIWNAPYWQSEVEHASNYTHYKLEGQWSCPSASDKWDM